MIAISGTHCSGKTTLAEDFVAAHREYAHEPEPFEWLVDGLSEELSAEPEVSDFYRQLEVSVERLSAYPALSRVVFERSPIDFIAYMLALRQARGRDVEHAIEPAAILAAQGMRKLDVLVVLPLNERDRIIAPESEDLDLREAMNDHLLNIIATNEYGLVSVRTRVIEVYGTRAGRLHQVERAIAPSKF
jgi:hypothetical protein